MDNLKQIIRAHVIDTCSGNTLTKPHMHYCPAVGDELRLADKDYWKVVVVVWCFDEPESPFQRVNIGVTKIPERPHVNQQK